jgi:hypothetical protein
MQFKGVISAEDAIKLRWNETMIMNWELEMAAQTAEISCSNSSELTESVRVSLTSRILKGFATASSLI